MASNNTFGKRLGSSDKAERDKGVKVLRRWLASHASELDGVTCRKLWVGLWYAFWLSDKVPVQQELAERLAHLVDSLDKSPDAGAIEWARAFVATMHRDWPKIDRLRLDKFYSLVRKVVRAFISFAVRNDVVEEFNEHVFLAFLTGVPGAADAPARGVQNHLIDLWWSEVDAAEDLDNEDLVTRTRLLRPFLDGLELTPDRDIAARMRDAVFRPVADGDVENVDRAFLAARLADIAIAPTVALGSRRKELFQLREMFAEWKEDDEEDSDDAAEDDDEDAASSASSASPDSSASSASSSSSSSPTAAANGAAAPSPAKKRRLSFHSKMELVMPFDKRYPASSCASPAKALKRKPKSLLKVPKSPILLSSVPYTFGK